jgi:ribokinase
MKVLTVGGAMIDTIAIIESDRIERMSMLNADTSFLLLQEGRKTEATEVSTHCGGGAVNAAVSMARLGMDVSTLIKLGKDDRAETVLAHLMHEGVSTRYALRDARAPTGASVLVASHERNAAVFTFRGANALLEPPDLRDDAFEVDVVYITNLSNKSADCYPLIVEKARARGALVAANPGVRQLSARGAAFRKMLGAVDILAINRAEAEVILTALVAEHGEGGQPLKAKKGEALPKLAQRGLTGGGFSMTLRGFLTALLTSGAPCVLLTDGRDGAYVARKGEIYHCPSLPMDAVAGTAGAGDAFTSTYTACKAQGQSVEQALLAGTLNAAAVLRHVDTQTGLMKRAALDKALRDTAGLPSVQKWTL